MVEQHNVAGNLDGEIFANVAIKKNTNQNNRNFGGNGNGGRGGNNSNNRGGRGGRGHGGRSQFHPVCQIYNKIGHLASNCYYRFDYNFTPPQ